MQNLVWGEDFNDYNTVVDSTYLPFWGLQTVRLLSLIALTVCTGLFVFIFGRNVIHYYSFWVIFISTLAFLFLLFGAGKQKCYQIMVENKKEWGIDYQDISKRTNLWRWGLVFYGLAAPISIASIMIYFIPFN